MFIIISQKLRDILFSINPSRIQGICESNTKFESYCLEVGFDDHDEYCEFRDQMQPLCNYFGYRVCFPTKNSWDHFFYKYIVNCNFHVEVDQTWLKGSNLFFEILIHRYYEKTLQEIPNDEYIAMRNDYKDSHYWRHFYLMRNKLAYSLHCIYIEKRYTFPIIKKEINDVLNGILYKDVANIIFDYFDDLIIYKSV